MLTAIQIWQRLNGMGVQKTLPEIQNALAQVDQQAIFNEERARYRVEKWDKKTPINGIEPEKILSRQDYPGGEIYLIYVDGRLQILQPHHPEEAGFVPLTEENVLEVGNAHADRLAWMSADAKIFERVLEILLSS